MTQLWTAQVHLLTPASTGGNTRCCTNVVAWASTAQDYESRLETVLMRRHWSILSIRQCIRVSDCIPTTEEMELQIQRANALPGCCIFGTLYYYPSKPS